MSVKNYLDIRYAFPGYTFILFVVGTSYPFFYEWLQTFPTDVSKIVVGIITVLGTSPIGFLISQLWYLFPIKNWFGSSVYGDQMENKKRKYVKLLHDNQVKKDRYSTVHVLDYLISNSNDNAKKYLSKRWDMYNIMGSTVIAIFIGWLFGILFRNHIVSYCIQGPIFHEWVVSAIGLILIIIFAKSGMPIMRKEHEYMTYTVINKEMKNPFWKDNFEAFFDT